jgi:hypothetical protein
MSKQSMREETSSSSPRSTLLTAVVADRPPNGRTADVSRPRRRPKVHRLRTCRWRGSAVPLPARPASCQFRFLTNAWLQPSSHRVAFSTLHPTPSSLPSNLVLLCCGPQAPFRRPSLPLPVSLPMFFPSATVRSVLRGASAQRAAPCATRATRIVLMLAQILDETAKRGITCAL